MKAGRTFSYARTWAWHLQRWLGALNTITGFVFQVPYVLHCWKDASCTEKWEMITRWNTCSCWNSNKRHRHTDFLPFKTEQAVISQQDVGRGPFWIERFYMLKLQEIIQITMQKKNEWAKREISHRSCSRRRLNCDIVDTNECFQGPNLQIWLTCYHHGLLLCSTSLSLWMEEEEDQYQNPVKPCLLEACWESKDHPRPIPWRKSLEVDLKQLLSPLSERGEQRSQQPPHRHPPTWAWSAMAAAAG